MRYICVVVALGLAVFGCVGARVWRPATVPKEAHSSGSYDVIHTNINGGKRTYEVYEHHELEEEVDNDGKSDENALQDDHQQNTLPPSDSDDSDESTDRPETSTEVGDCGKESEDLSKICASNTNKAIRLVAHPTDASNYVVCFKGHAHVRSCNIGKSFNVAFSKCLTESHNRAVAKLTHGDMEFNGDRKKWVSWIADHVKSNKWSHEDRKSNKHADLDDYLTTHLDINVNGDRKGWVSWADHHVESNEDSDNDWDTTIADTQAHPTGPGTEAEDSPEESKELSHLCLSNTKGFLLAAHPETDTKFVVCLSGKAYVCSCNQGKYFDAILSRCVSKSHQLSG